MALDKNYTGLTTLRAWWVKVKANLQYLDDRISTIITTPIDGAAAAQELVDAKASAVKLKAFDTIGARFEEAEQDHKTHLADVATWNITQFGASILANDNIDAINDAIEYAFAQGGGNVLIPEATFYIKPDDYLHWIKPLSNVNIIGKGKKSKLKISDDCGEFQAIFFQTPSSIAAVTGENTLAENVIFRNFAIDQNPDRTGDYYVSFAAKHLHMAIYLHHIVNVTVENCYFYNAYGINTVNVSERNQSKTCKININEFHWAIGKRLGTEDPNYVYDNSTIYAHVDDVEVIGNKFFCDAATANVSARGAIEAQSNAIVADNKINGYLIGVYVVSPDIVDMIEMNTTIRNNIMTNVGEGVKFWSRTDQQIDSVKVLDNHISLANNSKQLTVAMGITFGNALDLTGDCKNIDITGNTIIYESETRAGIDPFTNSGIKLSTSGGKLENINCKNNTVVNSPFNGLIIGGSPYVALPGEYENITIKGNKFINCGSNTGATVAVNKAALQVLEGTYKNSFFENNEIIDTTTVTYEKYYIYIGTTDVDASGLYIGNNTVKSNSAKLTYYDTHTTAATLVLHEDLPKFFKMSSVGAAGVANVDLDYKFRPGAYSIAMYEVAILTEVDAAGGYYSASAGYLTMYSLYTGSVVAIRLKYGEVVNAIGGLSGAMALVVTPVFVEGGVEKTEVPSLTNATLRIKIGGYQGGQEGKGLRIRIKKILGL